MLNFDYTNLTSPIRTIKGKVELLGGGSSTPTSISGEIINITDASPIEHELAISLISSAITDFSAVKVFRYGSKNLFIVTEETCVRSTSSSYQNFTIANNAIQFTDALSLVGFKMPVIPGKTYTFSFIADGFDSTRTMLMRMREYTAEPVTLNGELTSVNVSSFGLNGDRRYYTFTPAATTTWVTLGFYCGYTCTVKELQVEEGSVATAYEPANIQSATATANGQVVGITSTPTMTLISDTPGVIINAIYQIGGAEEAPGAEYTSEDALKEFKIDRTGENGKFFGFGIVQKIEAKLLDQNREIELAKDKKIKAWLTIDEEYISNYPAFYIDEPQRDEKTNELTVVGYDKLNAATAHTVSELALTTPYTIGEFAEACAELLGVGISDISDASFETQYEDGANFEGTETIREALNAVAEATQTIYFLDNNENLTFKRLDINGEPVLIINNEQYMELTCKSACILSDITHATELGDNLTASTGEPGVVQYVRDNPFWELREDTAQLLDNALAAISGITLTPFECSWRGNFLLEIGDKIGLITKNNETVISYLLDDSLTYNGGLFETTQWSYTENEGETASNPTTLGEVIKQTYAKVDKANKQIELVASETSAAMEAISTLQLDADSINASVSSLKEATEEALGSATDDIAELKSTVSAQMTAEDIKIEIASELSNGVDKVTTSTGFTFNEEGLTVNKEDSEMSTQITEDGMKVYKNDEAVLTANNVGVEAKNLHATTYLIIGTNSRFENFGTNRTGCFWIGGNS